MVRQKNWPLLLSAFLREKRKADFVWGENDCLLLAADGVLAITGSDPAAQWRRKYASKEEAVELLKAHGGVRGIITEGLGIEPHHEIMKAMRGDVAMINTPEGHAAGIVDDSGQFIAAPNYGGKGLVRVPLAAALKIWSY